MSDIVRNNPFRILGVYANATSSAIAGRSMQMLAKLRSGMKAEAAESLDPLCGSVTRTAENIAAARSALQRPSERLEHALFWFTSADAIDIAALDAIAKNNISLAEAIWEGSPESVSATHNLTVLLIATGRHAEAAAVADRLFADKAREVCSLLAPGASMSPTELTTLYRRLAPTAPAAPRPAESIVRDRPAVTPPPVEPEIVEVRPTPAPAPEIEEPEIVPPAEDSPAPAEPDVRGIMDYLNGCISRLTSEKPSIEACSRFFNETDNGMSRLRNELERRGPAAYRSWADGCARHLMSALSRLAPYKKGEAKTISAMNLLSKTKSWGLSPTAEKEVNDYLVHLHASKSDDSATVIVICAVAFFIFLLRACSY